LSALVAGIPEIADLPERLRGAGLRPGEPLVISGAAGALTGFLAAEAASTGPVLLVTADEERAAEIAADAQAAGRSGVFAAPEPSLTPYQGVAPSLKHRQSEFALLSALCDGQAGLALVPARFLFSRLPDPDAFRERRVRLERGGAVSMGPLLAFLAREGYHRTDLVLETGDFAARGGLVDVFTPDSPLPVRIELDGDEVASLRSFDPDTQRSEAALDRVVLGPLSVAAATEEALARLAQRLGRAPSGAETALFLAAAAGADATIFDFAPRAAIAVHEPAAVAQAILEWEARLAADARPEKNPIPPGEACHGAERLRSEIARRATLVFDRLALAAGTPWALEAEELPSYEGRVGEAAAEMKSLGESGHRVAVAVSPRGGAEKLARFLKEYGLPAVETCPARISAGFRLRSSRVALFSEEQIFGPERTVPPDRRRGARAFLSDLRDLKVGDYVVHADYGVGAFRGLRRIPVEGSEREFMEIGYADGRTLLLPVERLDLIQKYSGAEGIEPRLDRLGGASWERKKAAVRKAVRDLSGELLKLYARRAQAPGFAFSKDSPWQKEFEDAFEYLETPDQAQAIEDVKRDMEKPSPMDRLLCGDVGYGKTEVAMRAAFKAVLDGKQVAVLAPTTILADQHFRTFTRRFAAFPVTIALLSRFRDRREQKTVVEKVAEGTVDIVLATHRLLSRDIRFRDLGLLVVDEEQRFGVAQKERLKQLKTSIDILSMSATPIPRSLNMSLSGLRDLSIIETPPRDRLAIETQVVAKGDEVLREAIAFELARGGQVFYVHNRIETIGREKLRLEELLPKARIAVAHGQMREGELERTMLGFVSRRSDLLLATAIVENGIDIPSVNTILIDRADTFGLSQLYQLRGRVGRSDKAAYCYLLVEPDAALSETARQRLATIREFCDLGAGFRIAAKDLEIRGAGNFLGAEQSGHIAAVGFEMYLDLLEEAMREIKGEEVLPERSVAISLGGDLSIPPGYLPDESLRLALYKRVARARDDAEIAEIARETDDRFGPAPAAVRRLFDYGRLRRRAERLGVKTVERRGGAFRLTFDETSRVETGRLLEAVSATAGAALLPPGTITLAPGAELPAVLELLDRMLVREAA
jgi:transcription-repair coupling factor (superfamily II helicase)